MAFAKKVFSSQKITVQAGGQEFVTQALVSAYGAKQVFTDADVPAEIRSRVHGGINVVYKKISTRVKVVKEITQAGVVYHLRFSSPSPALLGQIEKDIKEAGISSPWVRALPRLECNLRDLPSPMIAVFFYKGRSHYLPVKNFTLGGLLLESDDHDLLNIGIGTVLEFDMMTNQGDKLSDLSAMICHASYESEDSSSTRIYWGMHFQAMKPENELSYRALIREYCQGLMGK